MGDRKQKKEERKRKLAQLKLKDYTEKRLDEEREKRLVFYIKESEKIDNVPTASRTGASKVFLSYSTLDSKYLRIQNCVRKLEKFPEIDKAYFWEVDSKENIVEFMDETLRKTDVFILFCTNNSMNSNSVKNEWQAAFQRANKGLLKIIPVFEDEDLVPPILGHFLNVKFTKDDFKGFIKKLYDEILR